MKITIADLYGRFFRGGQVSLLVLARKLVNAGNEVYAILGAGGEFKDALGRSGVETHVVNMPSPITPFITYNFVRNSIPITFLLRKMKPDIIHLNHARTALYTIPSAKLLNIPFVFHFRREQEVGILENIAFAFSNAIIADSRFSFLSIPSVFRDKTRIVYSPIEFARFSPSTKERLKGEAREILDIPKDAYVVGTVAHILPSKSLNLFVDVAQKTISRRDDVYFVVVGDEPTRSGRAKRHLERLVEKKGVSHRFFLIGFREDIHVFLSGFDIFVSTAAFEVLGRAVSEAQSMGIPVVATKVGAIPEVVEDGVTGFLLDFGDVDGMVDKIITFIDEPKIREKMSKRASEFIREKFPEKEHLKEIIGVYEYALGYR